MDVDSDGIRGDCGGGDWTSDDCNATGGGDVARNDFAVGVRGEYYAKYGAFIPEVEELIPKDVGVLSNVLIVVWGVEFGWVCADYECKGWIWIAAWDGSTVFPIVLLLEDDEDERNLAWRY